MIDIIFYIVVFFPFVKLLALNLATGNGIQLYSLFFMLFFCVLNFMQKKLKLSKELLHLYLGITISIVISMFFSYPTDSSQYFLIMRYIAIYVSVILSSCVSYYFIRKNGGIDEKKIKVVINIYLLVGLIQKFVNRNFLYFLIGFHRTSDSRGEIGLTAEPSYYGYMCVFFMILSFEFQKGKKIYFCNALFQLIFLAKSSIGILYMVIWAILYVIYYMKRLSIKGIIITVVAILGVVGGGYYILHSPFFEGQRIVYFLNILLQSNGWDDMLENLSADGSTMTRFNEIAKCFIGFIENRGLPNGLNSEVVQSGYGSFIYPLGFLGFIIIGRIFIIMRNGYKGINRFVIPFFWSIIMFSLIQISNPVVGYLIGMCSYKKSQLSIQKTNLNIGSGD